MNPKETSLILALENIDAASLHGLCDDLVFAGALILNLKGKLIRPKGWNPGKHHTIPSPADSLIELDEGLCVFEYSRRKDWDNKLKDDVESIKQWTEQSSQKLARFVFITTRGIGNRKIGRRGEDKLPPEEYIRKKFPHFNIQAYVIGQKDLLVPLQNSDYFYIRRRRLNIPEDYFLSLESFKSYHFNQAQDRHVYLKAFVPGTSREESIKALDNFASKTDARVLLVHSQGGIGKTRFVLESLKQIKKHDENIDILFNKRRKYVSVDEVIPEISSDRESLIVLDDAHLIDNLADFSNILSQRSRAKVILITRSTASESVKSTIGYPVEEIELSPLNRDSSIELLKGNLENPLIDESLRYAADICEGNPLLIGITAHLINKGEIQSFGDLKKNDLIGDYLKNILAELKQQNGLDRTIYEPYLALLYLLKPFAISDNETRSLIRSFPFLEIYKPQEGVLLRDLEGCAVLERHGDTLWLYPDLLGEYLVETTFFSGISILDFDDIFPRIPPSNMKSVFKTLRDLDNGKADLFLESWSNNLRNKVKSQNNFELCENLHLLEIIVPIPNVANEAFQIIDVLLRPENEKPLSTNEILGLATTTREYRAVLSRCLRILGSHRLRYDHFDDTLEMVLRIYFYKPEREEYSVLRKDALEAIAETAAYNLNVVEAGYGYSIQTRMFERVRAWKQENLEKNFTLILRVCRTLLETEIKSQYSDYEGIGWSFDPVQVTEELTRLRKDVIFLLQSIFGAVQESRQRIEVLSILKCVLSPSGANYDKNMSEMIRDNANTIINYYLELVNHTSPPEVQVLEEIEQQAHHLQVWHDDDIKIMNVVNQLQSVLQSHAPYQLFRMLAGDDSLFRRRERDSKIKEIADGITDENFSEWLEKLNNIAIILSQNSDRSPWSFRQFLFEIGKNKPQIAQALIDNSLRENNTLKEFVAEFIRGIRTSRHPDIASGYVRQWLSGEDRLLMLEIPETYRAVDEKLLDAKDVDTFTSLLNYRMGDSEHDQRLNIGIMSNISWVYKKNPSKATEIICQLFRAADQNSIQDYVRELWGARNQIDLSQWELPHFEEILKNLENLSEINNNAIPILAEYGKKEPLRLIQFFERRVGKQTEQDSFSGFRAIPHRPNLKKIAKVYQAHPQYSEAINRIMEWFQIEDFRYEHAAANLISGISPELDGPLKKTLLTMIKSGDENKLKIVLTVLEKFPDDPALAALCKDAVEYSQGKKELQDRIEFFILYNLRGSVVIPLKEKLCSWLDDENQYVRNFAEKAIRSLKAKNEFDAKWAAEEEIKRKKGLR